MARLLGLIYGLVAYAAFLGSISYLVVFLGYYVFPESLREGLYRVAPWSCDADVGGPADWAVLTNLLLLSGFAVPHSIMARPAFKRAWTQVVPEALERSTFVLVAAAMMTLLFWQWRPIQEQVWNLSGTWAEPVLRVTYFLGFAIAVGSTFLIDHFDLAGLRQAWCYFRGQPCGHPVFRVRSLYRWTRHPIMLGFLIAFWSAPVMTLGHLLFSLGMSVYVLVGVWLEERTLAALHGDSYRAYQSQTSMLLPLRWSGAKDARNA